jgi:uncharacterized membrane protein
MISRPPQPLDKRGRSLYDPATRSDGYPALSADFLWFFMTSIEIVSLVSRWFHILAGMTAVGGMIFLRCVVVSPFLALPKAQFEPLHAQMRPRWARLVAMAVGILLISGLVTFGINASQYVLPKWYHMVWGIKFLIALVIFFLLSALAGKSALAEKLRQNIKLWLNLTILLSVVVVCLSGVLKMANKMPKNAANAPAADVTASPD